MSRIAWVVLFTGLLVAVTAAGGLKTISGELHSLKDNVLTIRKIGLFSKSNDTVEIEMNDATKTTGQLALGLHVKVKYREENGRKIAVEIETQPAYASKAAKKAAGQTRK
jgi:hypothetical protein